MIEEMEDGVREVMQAERYMWILFSTCFWFFDTLGVCVLFGFVLTLAPTYLLVIAYTSPRMWQAEIFRKTYFFEVIVIAV